MNLSKVLGQRVVGLLCGLGLLGLLLSGCGTTSSDDKFAKPPVDVLPPSATTSKILDVLQPGMSVLVSITDTPTQIQPYRDQIKQDGTITLLLNKTFVAAGKTRRELEQEVHDYYVPAFYKQMTVSIQAEQQTRFYFVDGEVKLSGRQVYIGPITVLGAIASAGGFTDFASKSSVKLIHPDGRIQIINCKKALKDPSLDMPVYPEDKVIVPRRWL